MIPRAPSRIGADALFAAACVASGLLLGAPLGFAVCLLLLGSWQP